jgi:predicted Co/Zn/Cd cation transporter (cation efflux family)
LLLGLALAIVAMSAVRVAISLLINSKAVAFDGIYDAGMTMTSESVTRLIGRSTGRHFQYGYWHLETMLVFLSSAIVVFACLQLLLTALAVC